MPHNHVQPNIDLLKKLPQVEEVLKRPQLVDLAARFPREKLAQSVREAVDAVRQRILAGEEPDESIDAPGPPSRRSRSNAPRCAA